MEAGVEPELQARIREIGERVREVATGNVSHRTGRHSKGKRLEDSLKVSSTLKSASVYATAVHGGVANVGGRIGRNRATLITRAEASHFMDRAVKSEQPFVETELRAVLSWLMTTFIEG